MLTDKEMLTIAEHFIRKIVAKNIEIMTITNAIIKNLMVIFTSSIQKIYFDRRI